MPTPPLPCHEHCPVRSEISDIKNEVIKIRRAIIGDDEYNPDPNSLAPRVQALEAKTKDLDTTKKAMVYMARTFLIALLGTIGLAIWNHIFSGGTHHP